MCYGRDGSARGDRNPGSFGGRRSMKSHTSFREFVSADKSATHSMMVEASHSSLGCDIRNFGHLR